MKLLQIEKYCKVFFLVGIFFSLSLRTEQEEYFDVMVEFAYPISVMQAARYDVSQAVYALQSQDHDNAVSYLEEALSKLDVRLLDRKEQSMELDDAQFLQEMLDKINALIDQLEGADRAVVEQLCSKIQNFI